MRSFGEMVEETLGYLRAQVRDQEMSTHLVDAAQFDDYTLIVNDPSVLSRGRIEIDDEIIWVDSTDRSTASVAVPPYGRGMDGTTRANHEAGTRVIIQPLYPRKVVKDTLNQSIVAAGNRLYGVERIELTPDLTGFMYPLPEHVRDVLAVSICDQTTISMGGEVRWLRSFTFDKRAPLQVSTTGKALYLTDVGYGPQDVITVVASRDPARLLFNTQMFEESFLPASAWDIPVLMSASRLLITAQSYFLQGRSVEANTLDSKIQADDAGRQSKYLYQLAESRLEEERQRLLSATIQRAHYVAR
jgi:hypothetical protein